MTEIKLYAKECFELEAQALLDLIPLLTDDFDKAVQLISECKGKIVVTGVGKSGHCGAKIAATLASTGTPAFFVNPLDAFHGDLGMISCGDIVVMISNSGQTDELLRLVPYLTDRNIPIVTITSDPDSLLATHGTYHLNIKVRREACPLNLAPTSSTTATLAMGDALACALIRVKHFQTKDFAKFHPGGSLGKRLLARVKDVMKRDNLPFTSKSHKLSEAIFEISKSNAGIAVVITNGCIEGVITDGDIRRAMLTKQEIFFNLTVKDVMTNNPKIILDSALISDAEVIMQKNNIHTLIVANKDNEFVGIVDYIDFI